MSTAPFPSPTKIWHDNTYDAISPARPELSAKGKTIIITGGGSGIGAETARSFAQAGAARIAVLGRREQPLLDTKASIESKYPNVEVFTASTDVYNRDSVNQVFAQFLGDSKIDVLVSGVGFTGAQEGVAAVDPEAFLSAVDKSLRNTINVAQAFIRHAAPDAVVIDINSSAAHANFGDAFAAYSVGKLGTYRIWNALGSANPDIKVFSIQPGVVDTDMNKEVGGVATMGFEDHVSLPANFIVWLASPESTFLNGKFLWANWDVEELKQQRKEIEETGKYDLQVVGWPFGQPIQTPKFER